MGADCAVLLPDPATTCTARGAPRSRRMSHPPVLLVAKVKGYSWWPAREEDPLKHGITERKVKVTQLVCVIILNLLDGHLRTSDCYETHG